MDISMVLLAAPLVVPMVVVLAAFIALDGHNPFYGQRRVGRFGRVFTIWKLRSMVADADVQLQRFLAEDPEARAEWERTQKLKNDPRITRVGRIIRKTSLDELPQLWNVLTGDMSLVGPRPMMCNQQKLYPGAAYYSLRPGITGLWQISARNNCEFSGRARFDTKYEHQLTFATDMGILVRTVGVVARGTGY
ncbi:MAG: sugar transferase [Pseudomonadota bacterium]